MVKSRRRKADGKLYISGSESTVSVSRTLREQVWLRIDGSPVYLHLEMKVIACGIAGSAAQTDLLSFFHLVADLYIQLFVMHVFGYKAVAVVNGDPPSGGIIPPGCYHSAGSHRIGGDILGTCSKVPLW